MRVAWWFVVVCACERPARQPAAPTAPPRDAANAAVDATVDATVDAAPPDAAPLEPMLSCDGTMRVKGWLRVRVDPKTLRGSIDRVTSGAALTRHIDVVARPDGTTMTLIFDGYGPTDHTTIRGQRKPRPAAERLVKGTSIVGRLVAVPGVTRLYVDHDVDWVTDAHLEVQDGYTVCAPKMEGSP